VIGLIVIFPLLGHATWHAYRAIRISRGERVFYWPEPDASPLGGGS
jgi:uncharacterized membrane protein